jgi:hydroxysqualene synthase
MKSTTAVSHAEVVSEESPPVSLPDAYRHCESIVRAHDENFPVVSRFLAPSKRPALAAIYAFARGSDDIADAAAPCSQRLEGLDRMEAALLRALDGEPEGPVLTALADAVERHRLPTEPFFDLLAAFRRDAADEMFGTWDDLLSYCRGSANTIGRLVLALHEIDDADALRESDCVCTALQLTNFWQDLGRDLARGRVFLPREDLAHFGLHPEDFFHAVNRGRLSRLLVHECRAVHDLYDRGRPIVRRVPGGLSLQLRMTLAGGRAVLREVERRGWRVLKYRPSLGRAGRARVLLRALFRVDG